MSGKMRSKTDVFAEGVIERYCRITRGNKTQEQRKFAIERYMHRRKGREGTLTVEEWNKVCEVYDYCCYWCGEKVKTMTQEHLVQKRNRGGFTRENIRPACERCNNGRSQMWSKLIILGES